MNYIKVFQQYSVSVLACAASFFLMACSGGGDRGVNVTIKNDFLKSKVVATGYGLSDNSTFYYFDVHLINSDDTVVPNWMPQLAVPNLPLTVSISSLTCTLSNAQGISKCAVKANTPGVYKIRIGNLEHIDVSADITFKLPGGKINYFRNVSASVTGATGSGYKVDATVHHTKMPLKTTASGYTVYHGLEGIKASQ